MARLIVDLKKAGVAGGVYTQTTDVEGEVNGLLTYDRKHIKLDTNWLREQHRNRLYKDNSASAEESKK